jgi:hypothetical protein
MLRKNVSVDLMKSTQAERAPFRVQWLLQGRVVGLYFVRKQG